MPHAEAVLCPPSVYARPVWLALLEKQLPFELISVDLSGQQFEPDFLAVNPFGHIPVLVDEGFRVIESLAILDYLEARHPERALLPTEPRALAKVRMVQLVAFHELLPAVFKLLMQDKRPGEPSVEIEYAQLRAKTTLAFLEDMLADSQYFAGDQLTLAEIVAGTIVHKMPDLGISLVGYPGLKRWSEPLLARPTWQQIELSADEWSNFRRRMRVMPKIWQRRRRQRVAALMQQQALTI